MKIKTSNIVLRPWEYIWDCYTLNEYITQNAVWKCDHLIKWPSGGGCNSHQWEVFHDVYTVFGTYQKQNNGGKKETSGLKQTRELTSFQW